MVFIKYASYFLICLLFQCSAIFAKEKDHEEDYFDHVDRIKQEFIQEMEKTYGWNCIGISGRMPKQVETISVNFDLARRATIEEARALEVMATERFSEMINADKKIRFHLCEFPFPSYRTQIGLSFQTSLGTRPTDESVVSISQSRNTVFYRSYDVLTGRLIKILEEPYPEAKKIVESSPGLNLFVHQEKPYESPIDAIFNTYLTEMFKNYKLECERMSEKVGDGIIEEVVASLIYFHPTQIDKARELQVIATEKLLEAINSNEKLRPYLKSYPFSPKQLKVAVLFRKSNYSPYFDGTLDSVQQSGDEVTYLTRHQFDGDAEIQSFPQELPIVAIESFREAVGKVRTQLATQQEIKR